MLLSELIRLSGAQCSIDKDVDIKVFADYASDAEGAIGYAGSASFVQRFLLKNNFVCILVPDNIPRTDGRCISVEEPKALFYQLYTVWSQQQVYAPNVIADSATIHPSAHIDECGVQIGAHTTIAAGAAILRGSVIGQYCHIGENAAIGGSGFIVDCPHGKNQVIAFYGFLRIGHYVSIGRLCNIDKGCLGIDTVIGDETCIDANTYIAHTVQIGRKNIIAAGVSIGGHTRIQDENFIGMNTTIAHRASIGSHNFIGMHRTIVGEVADGHKITCFSDTSAGLSHSD